VRRGQVSVLVIRPHYEEVRTSAANGFTEVAFYADALRLALPVFSCAAVFTSSDVVAGEVPFCKDRAESLFVIC
jgi:hypothetical protein